MPRGAQQNRHASESRCGVRLKRNHRPEQNRSGEQIRVCQQYAGCDVCAVRITHCDDLSSVQPVFFRGVHDELPQCFRLNLEIIEIENAGGETPKKPRHAVFEYASTRAEQRSAREKLVAQWDQVLFIAACSMQKQQSDWGPSRFGSDEAMNKVGIGDDHLDGTSAFR